MRLAILSAATILGIACTTSALGQQGLRLPGLDEYCKLTQTTSRETIIYIDGSIVTTTQQAAELADIVSQKIGLAPRERVRIFYVRSSEDAKEVFNKCWPDLTPEEAAAKSPSSSSWRDWFSWALDETPETKLKDTKDFFRLNVQNSIGNELVGKVASNIDFVRVLSADKDRLGSGGRLYRILIYSPMQSAVMREAAKPNSQKMSSDSERIDSLFREYPISLYGAETIIWGVVADEQVPLRASERYWTGYLQRGMSNLKSFAPELPIQQSVSISSPLTLAGTWKSPQGNGRANISLAWTRDRKLTSSWVTIQASRAFAIPIEGTYRCDASNLCRVEATIGHDVPYLLEKPFFLEGDVVELTGDPTNLLSGTIKPAAAAKFPSGTPAAYAVEFRKQ